MKTLSMMIVLALASAAFAAETDAEKIERLEKENAALRAELSKAVRIIAELREPKKLPDSAAKPDKPAKATRILLDRAGLMKAVPKELIETSDNAAKGKIYSPAAVNGWLEENLVGKECITHAFNFNGKVEEITSIPRGSPLSLDDVGGFLISYNHDHDATPYQWFVFTKDQKDAIAKLEEGQWVVITGRIRKASANSALNEDGKKVFASVFVIVENAVISPTKAPSEK